MNRSFLPIWLVSDRVLSSIVLLLMLLFSGYASSNASILLNDSTNINANQNAIKNTTSLNLLEYGAKLYFADEMPLKHIPPPVPKYPAEFIKKLRPNATIDHINGGS